MSEFLRYLDSDASSLSIEDQLIQDEESREEREYELSTLSVDPRLSYLSDHTRAAILAYFDGDVEGAMHKACVMANTYRRIPAWAEELNRFDKSHWSHA